MDNQQPGQQNLVVKSSMAVWKIVAISIIVGVLIGGGVYAIFQKFVKIEAEPASTELATSTEMVASTTPEKTEVPVSTPVTLVTTSPSTSPKQPSQPQVVNCGTSLNYANFGCFNTAIKNCTLAKIISKDEQEIFGMTSKAAAVYEIRGKQGNTCIFYLKVTSGGISFSKEAVQQMRDDGMTTEEIAQQEKEANKAAQSLVGREGSCKFSNAADLLKVFSNWKEGKFSTADFSGMDCWGEYFGTGGQKANVSKTISMEACVAQKGYATAVTSAGAACFKSDVDLGMIVGSGTVNGKNPQCCAAR